MTTFVSSELIQEAETMGVTCMFPFVVSTVTSQVEHSALILNLLEKEGKCHNSQYSASFFRFFKQYLNSSMELHVTLNRCP